MTLNHQSDGADSLERAKMRLKRQIIYLFLFFVAIVVAQRYINQQILGTTSSVIELPVSSDHEVSLDSESGPMAGK